MLPLLTLKTSMLSPSPLCPWGSSYTRHTTLTLLIVSHPYHSRLKFWARQVLPGSMFLLYVSPTSLTASPRSLMLFHSSTKPKWWGMGLQLSSRLLSGDTQGPGIWALMFLMIKSPNNIFNIPAGMKQSFKTNAERSLHPEARRGDGFSLLGAILNRDRKLSLMTSWWPGSCEILWSLMLRASHPHPTLTSNLL